MNAPSIHAASSLSGSSINTANRSPRQIELCNRGIPGDNTDDNGYLQVDTGEVAEHLEVPEEIVLKVRKTSIAGSAGHLRQESP